VVHAGSSLRGEPCEIVDLTRRRVLQGAITSANTPISLEQLPADLHLMRLPERNGLVRRIVKD
jgi:hypothetical protein